MLLLANRHVENFFRRARKHGFIRRELISRRQGPPVSFLNGNALDSPNDFLNLRWTELRWAEAIRSKLGFDLLDELPRGAFFALVVIRFVQFVGHVLTVSRH
jgi:hypothetical protein